jgi:hypothetical protein
MGRRDLLAGTRLISIKFGGQSGVPRASPSARTVHPLVVISATTVRVV